MQCVSYFFVITALASSVANELYHCPRVTFRCLGLCTRVHPSRAQCTRPGMFLSMPRSFSKLVPSGGVRASLITSVSVLDFTCAQGQLAFYRRTLVRGPQRQSLGSVSSPPQHFIRRTVPQGPRAFDRPSPGHLVTSGHIRCHTISSASVAYLGDDA